MNLLNLEGMRCQDAFHRARLAVRNWKNTPLSGNELIIVTIDNQLEANLALFLKNEYPDATATIMERVPLTDEIRQKLMESWEQEYDIEDILTAEFGKVITIKT